MASSRVYTFADNYTVVDLITEAYERCGVFGPTLNANHQQSAKTSLNLVFSELATHQLGMWTVDQQMLQLNEGQSDYQLPAGTVDVLDVLRRSYTRQNSDGTAASSAGGTAANAFDGDPDTACTQTSADGNISYDYGSDDADWQTISMVGIRSNVQANYTLVVETTTDNTTWTARLTLPRQAYVKGIIQWYAIPAAVQARAIRVRETGGATLNVEEIYFATQDQDIGLGRMSRDQYFAISNKTETGTPTSFFVDRQVAPVLRIWQPSDGTTTMLFYTRIRTVQSITNYTQTADVPFHFLEAVTAMLAKRLAFKFARDRLDALAVDAKEKLDLAKAEDRERAPTSFSVDASCWG